MIQKTILVHHPTRAKQPRQTSPKKEEDTAHIFNIGNSREDSYRTLREHLLNLYGEIIFRDSLGPEDSTLCDPQRFTFNNAEVAPVNYSTPLECSLQLQEVADNSI